MREELEIGYYFIVRSGLRKRGCPAAKPALGLQIVSGAFSECVTRGELVAQKTE